MWGRWSTRTGQGEVWSREEKNWKEKQANVEQMERAVAMLEDWVGRGRTLKGGGRSGRGEGEGGAGDEGDGGEGRVHRHGVVEGGFGKPGRGEASCMCPRTPRSSRAQTPMGSTPPLLLPPESLVRTLGFVMHRAHHKIFGEGRWVSVDERRAHADNPLRVGGFKGNGKGSRNCWGEEKWSRLYDKGVKIFEMS